MQIRGNNKIFVVLTTYKVKKSPVSALRKTGDFICATYQIFPLKYFTADVKSPMSYSPGTFL